MRLLAVVIIEHAERREQHRARGTRALRDPRGAGTTTDEQQRERGRDHDDDPEEHAERVDAHHARPRCVIGPSSRTSFHCQNSMPPAVSTPTAASTSSAAMVRRGR